MTKNVLGIDVAKSKLEVVLLVNGKEVVGQFENSAKGFKRMRSWLKFHGAGGGGRGACVSGGDRPVF